MTYLFLNFFTFLGFVIFFKLWQISENFSNVFAEKNPCISEPMQFKSMLFKGQWSWKELVQGPLLQITGRKTPFKGQIASASIFAHHWLSGCTAQLFCGGLKAAVGHSWTSGCCSVSIKLNLQNQAVLLWTSLLTLSVECLVPETFDIYLISLVCLIKKKENKRKLFLTV